MKHLLINGCSYATVWHDTKQDKELASLLNADTISNLGKSGSSNSRIFHSTMEFISKNPTVDFVILSLTFCTRFDAPWADTADRYDGYWINYSPGGIFESELPRMKNKNSAEMDKLNKYVQDRVVLDNGSEYTDRHLGEIIKFSAWFDSKNIKYCMFNAAEDIIKQSISANQLNPEKLRWITENKKIIDIENFISNQWMYDNGAKMNKQEIDNKVEPRWAHYGKDGYALLNNFLYNYINENCL